MSRAPPPGSGPLRTGFRTWRCAAQGWVWCAPCLAASAGPATNPVTDPVTDPVTAKGNGPVTGSGFAPVTVPLGQAPADTGLRRPRMLRSWSEGVIQGIAEFVSLARGAKPPLVKRGGGVSSRSCVALVPCALPPPVPGLPSPQCRGRAGGCPAAHHPHHPPCVVCKQRVGV